MRLGITIASTLRRLRCIRAASRCAHWRTSYRLWCSAISIALAWDGLMLRFRLRAARARSARLTPLRAVGAGGAAASASVTHTSDGRAISV